MSPDPVAFHKKQNIKRYQFTIDGAPLDDASVKSVKIRMSDPPEPEIETDRYQLI
jgi:hypothetical protein